MNLVTVTTALELRNLGYPQTESMHVWHKSYFTGWRVELRTDIINIPFAGRTIIAAPFDHDALVWRIKNPTGVDNPYKQFHTDSTGPR